MVEVRIFSCCSPWPASLEEPHRQTLLVCLPGIDLRQTITLSRDNETLYYEKLIIKVI